VLVNWGAYIWGAYIQGAKIPDFMVYNSKFQRFEILGTFSTFNQIFKKIEVEEQKI